jgi:hypothetical protein
VRKTQESTGKPGEDELAAILGTRLPKPESISCVHLVSVEGRYKYESNKIVFNDQGTKGGDSIRLVSLKSWRFTCADPKSNFKELLKKLDHSRSLRLLDPEPTGADSSVIDAAKRYLAMGCVPLPHAMRQGNKTVSWYRGPLAPGNIQTKELTLPIRSADELVYYDDTYGMFDVSYAAAWELGRLLALQSKSFSVNLYRWKRSHARKEKAAKLKAAEIQLTHLPFHGPTADLELPETVSSWFENLILLEGVPFHYLVPDERMLPAESICFFQMDPIWMECLVDGAFSVGRVLKSDHKQDRSHKENHLDDVLPERASGFLLRSEAVAGWPGLQVDGYDEPIQKEDFVLEKAPLFELDPADCVSDLNRKTISTALKQKFLLAGQTELPEKCTVENQEWLISSGQQAFNLIKRENNQIDVCSAADRKYLFGISGGFETDLNAGNLSGELRRAFADVAQVLEAFYNSPDGNGNLTNSKLFYRIGKGNLAAVEVNQLRGKLVLLCDNEELNSSHFKPGDGYCLYEKYSPTPPSTSAQIRFCGKYTGDLKTKAKTSKKDNGNWSPEGAVKNAEEACQEHKNHPSDHLFWVYWQQTGGNVRENTTAAEGMHNRLDNFLSTIRASNKTLPLPNVIGHDFVNNFTCGAIAKMNADVSTELEPYSF